MPKNKSKSKTEWNLGLLYKSPKDPQIEKDIRTIEAAFNNFEKKYKDKDDYLKNEAALFRALTDGEKLRDIVGSTRPLHYFHLLKDIDSQNKIAEARLNQLSEHLTKVSNKVLFFELKLGKIPPNLQKRFLQSRKLEHFRYQLKLIFDQSRHNLTEPEEKIMNLKSLPAYSMWVNSSEKYLSKQEISFKRKMLPIAEAIGRVSSLPTPDRRNLMRDVMKKCKEISDFAEAELNAVITNKKINDELRHFKNPYDATLLSYETSEKMVLNLIDTVTKNFKISHDFYKLKAKLMRLPYLTYADRNAKVGKSTKVYKWKETLKTVENAFEIVSPKYADILKSYVKRGQIDVYPNKGKTGGAYCSGGLNIDTFVLLNHTDSLGSVMTLGHEMGHAIHTELSKVQSPLYQGYTIAAAEVASTLFENFVFDQIFETLSPKEKVIALHNRLNDDIQTIFRQIACFNFENDLHQKIRKDGAISKEEIAALMNKHMKSYLGPITRLEEVDGYFFVYWSHIRRFFYVYTYAFGQIVSKALYKKYREDKNFLNKIEQFLKAGGSKSPEDIFKDIGIDVTKPDFFQRGLDQIKGDIKELEKLAKEAKLI